LRARAASAKRPIIERRDGSPISESVIAMAAAVVVGTGEAASARTASHEARTTRGRGIDQKMFVRAFADMQPRYPTQFSLQIFYVLQRGHDFLRTAM
jgi:hypothetical protein